MTMIQSGLNANFYVFVAVLIIGLLFVAHSIKKLKYSRKQVWRSIWISFVIALAVSLIFSFVLSLLIRPVFMEKMRTDCASPPCPFGNGYNASGTFWMLLVISLSATFFVVLVIYYIVALIKNRKKV